MGTLKVIAHDPCVGRLVSSVGRKKKSPRSAVCRGGRQIGELIKTIINQSNRLS